MGKALDFEKNGGGTRQSRKDGSVPCGLRKTQFTCIHKMEKTQRDGWKKLKAVMDGWMDPGQDAFFQYGFEVLGPLLFGFCRWLHERAAEQKVGRLFFLSRDGYLILKAYEELFPSGTVPASYLYISRKAARGAQLWLHPDLTEVVGHFPQYAYLECREFCRYFNIESHEAEHAWEDCGLGKNRRFLPGDLLHDKQLAEFYERMKPWIMEESRKAYAGMAGYLRQNQFAGKVGVVDIGWKGTIQNCLEVILQDGMRMECEIVGCYLGLSRDAACAGNKLSYIPPAEDVQEFDAGFVEYPFLAPEGSLLGYSHGEDDAVKPVLADDEYDSGSRLAAQNIQEGALYFIKCAKELPVGSFIWDPSFSYANLKRISKCPRLWEAELFGDLAYYDGGKRQIAAPGSFTHYLLHMKDFPYDLSVSGWRIAFLKRLFKIGFDYNKMLKIYKNIH